MGWVAITQDYKLLQEEDGITEFNPGGGRPVAMGNKNKLRVVGASAYGHSVAVDLLNGVIALDYTRIGVQNETIELENVKNFIAICDETAIVGEMKKRKATIPDEDGNYYMTYTDLIWRPIWFNRMISTLPGPVVVIGAQTTLPKDQGGRRIKKLVSLFPDGRIGIS